MDSTTFGGLSVAHYVAFRKLTDEEIEVVIKKEPGVLSRASSAMSRVSFVDELRYSVSLDYTDLIEGMYRDGLETYLLCTCIDTIAGKDNYFDLQNWLRTKTSENALGLAQKQEIFQKTQVKETPLTPESFDSILSQILYLYNKNYGINENIRQLILSLPPQIKQEFANTYIIHKGTEHNNEETWNNKTVDAKLKNIFIDYLFHYRRNLYTHESTSTREFGGVRLMREKLHNNDVDLPGPATLQLHSKNGQLIVTCKYGDEALFLREVVFACLAKSLGVLDADWVNRYREAERKRRILYALYYEVKNNIRVMQLCLQVLSESVLTDGKGSPHLKSETVEYLVEHFQDVNLPVYKHFLEDYIKAVADFNENIDATGAGFKRNFEDASQDVNDLMVKSEVRWRGQMLGQRCNELLENYPSWTLPYFPQVSAI